MEEYDDQFMVCPHCGYIEGTGPKEAYHLAPGAVLQNKYIVGKAIGYGGFGVTYIGYDYVLNHKIAIKEYLPGEFSTRCVGETSVTVFEGEKREQFDDGIQKFIEEARKLAAFRHVEGVTTVYDCFRENETAYIVMEYLEGRTLKEIIEEKGPLSYEEATGYIVPILDALTEIHKDGLLHRDISPDNIFVTNDGRVKLIDFGAARYATTTHSKSLSVIVKPGYAPQEQYRSRGDQGPWTDVYASAATFYKMITGITPEDSMERGEKDALKLPRKLGVRLPKNKQNALMNALNLKVEDRTQSAEAFKEELLSENFVQRRKNTLKKMDIGKWPLWLKIASGTGVLAVVTMIVLLLTGVIKFEFHNGRLRFSVGGDDTRVPAVVNYTLAEAEQKIDGAKMIMQIVDKRHSDEIPRDAVLSQNIRSGSVVPKGSVLEITVSAGGEIIYLENYVGSGGAESAAALEEMGMIYFIEEEESAFAPGYVLSQSVEEGTGIEKGSQITLRVSKGIASYDPKKSTSVPELTGVSLDDGLTRIREKNLYITVIGQEYSDTIPKGQIMAQDTSAGKSAKEGDVIGVTLSLGLRTVHVPDVQYKSQSEAVQTLEGLGLAAVLVEEDSDTVAKGNVIRQSVEPGTEVTVFTNGVPTEITLYISKGNPLAENAPEVKNTESSTTETPVTEAATKQVAENTTETREASTQTVAVQDPVQETSTQASTQAATQAPVDTTVAVPAVEGKSLSDAKSALSSAGLVTGSVSYENTADKSLDAKVKKQGTASGTKVEKGTAVNLTVYQYNEHTGKAEVPDLSGMTESKAAATLLAAGLSLGEVGYTEVSGKASVDKTVATQSEKAGGWIQTGSKVGITLYRNIVDWTLAANVPSGATVVSRKWVYDQTVTEYKDSTSSTMSGWTLTGSEISSWSQSGGESDWVTSVPSNTDTAHYEVTATDNVAAVTKTQYQYSRYYGKGDQWYKALPFKSGVCVNYETTNWLDSPLPDEGTDTIAGGQYEQYGRAYDTNGNSTGTYKTGGRWDIWWYNQTTQTVEVSGAYTRYKYITKVPVYVYHFERTTVTKNLESDTAVKAGKGISNVREMCTYYIP